LNHLPRSRHGRPSSRARSGLGLCLGLVAAAFVVRADTTPRAATADRLRPSGLEGAVVAVGGQPSAGWALRRFVECAGGEKAEVVVATVGGANAGGLLDDLNALKAARVTALALTTRDAANDPRAAQALQQASGVWLVATGTPARAAGLLRETTAAQVLRAARLRGRVIAASGSATPLLGQVFVGPTETATGLDILPGTLIDAGPGPKDGASPLMTALQAHPGLLGVRIGDGGALIVRGREMRSVGPGTVTLSLPRTSNRAPRTVDLGPDGRADYNELRRAARSRSQTAYPPKEAPVPDVPHGALVIVGGGMPADVEKKFVELGGGPDGSFVVLPISNPDPLPPDSGAGFRRRYGVKNVTVLTAREPEDVEGPQTLEALKTATAVWFGGGRQWRFVDAYEGTKAHELFRAVLRRGGVIGGSSAGATIQGDYLVRGAPAGPNIMMCEGYERALGFLPGVAIDQHFTQRKRFPDMTALMATYPQFLGLGLDEDTAIVVKGHVAEVMGRGQVHVYDRRKPVADGQPDHDSYGAGTRYDLKERRALAP
jgi:cyanophycinase